MDIFSKYSFMFRITSVVAPMAIYCLFSYYFPSQPVSQICNNVDEKSDDSVVHHDYNPVVLSLSTDPRFRVICLIEKHGKSFHAEALIDPGDTEELYLPARRIYQLGLEKLQTTMKSRSTHNTMAEHYIFDAVRVELKMIDVSDVEHIGESFLVVHCLKSAYDEYLQGVISEPEPDDIVSAPLSKVPVIGSRASGERKITIKLSPTTHRATDNKNQRVSIGIRGCQKLSFGLKSIKSLI